MWIKSVSAKDSEREEVDNDCESDSETEVDKDCESDKFDDTELFASWNLEDSENEKVDKDCDEGAAQW